jgi:hypothetical protein
MDISQRREFMPACLFSSSLEFDKPIAFSGGEHLASFRVFGDLAAPSQAAQGKFRGYWFVEIVEV